MSVTRFKAPKREGPKHNDTRKLRKFAWLPTYVSMGYVIWMGKYTEQQVYVETGYDGGFWETIWRHDNV